MKKLILLILFTFSLLPACKKKDPESTYEPVPCPTLDPLKYHGVLWNDIYSDNFGDKNVMTTTQTFFARFSSTPSDWPCNEISSNHISVNNFTLNYQGNAGCSSGYFTSKTNPVLSDTDNWDLSGDSLPNFQYSNKDLLPKYSGLHLIPDTISKTAGCTFTLNVSDFSAGSLTAADSIYGVVSAKNLTFTLHTGVNVITLSPQQLSSWGISNSGSIVFNLTNASTVNACSRNYRFIKNVKVAKRLVVKP